MNMGYLGHVCTKSPFKNERIKFKTPFEPMSAVSKLPRPSPPVLDRPTYRALTVMTGVFFDVPISNGPPSGISAPLIRLRYVSPSTR